VTGAERLFVSSRQEIFISALPNHHSVKQYEVFLVKIQNICVLFVVTFRITQLLE
jgi:hypothetical protein